MKFTIGKKTKFNSVTTKAFQKLVYHEVEGYPVEIKGDLSNESIGWSLMVHRPIRKDFFQSSDFWSLSCGLTGRLVFGSTCAVSRKEMIQEAIKYLEGMGIETVRKAIEIAKKDMKDGKVDYERFNKEMKGK